MRLNVIIKTTAKNMRNSGFTVDADSGMSTVAIVDKEGETVCFMQGDEADKFNDEAQALYNRARVVTMDDCELCVASPYVDCL